MFTQCKQNKEKTDSVCYFTTDQNGRVEERGQLKKHTSLEIKKEELQRWIKESKIGSALDLIVLSTDSTSFSARALFPFTIIHESEKDTFLEPTNLKFDIYIEITETTLNYYFLDFQLYYDPPANPFAGSGRIKGYNDKEYLNKYTQHCNPNKKTYQEIEDVISKELRQTPKYFKKPPSKKECKKYVLRVVNQAQEISKEAQDKISLTKESIIQNFSSKEER